MSRLSEKYPDNFQSRLLNHDHGQRRGRHSKPGGVFVLKSSRIVLIMLASLLLFFPTGRATPAPVSSAALTHGTVSLIGTVDVSSLRVFNVQDQAGRIVSPLHPQGEQSFKEAKVEASQKGYVPAGEATKTVSSGLSLVPSPLTTTVGLVLEGAAGGPPNPCACTPPDGAVGAGPNHVFEMVNIAGIIYTKAGAVAKATFGLDGFFNLPASSLSDPQVSGQRFKDICERSRLPAARPRCRSSHRPSNWRSAAC